MAPKNLKRPSVAADGGAIKKQCSAVVKALSEAELPASAVEALKAAAPFALMTYADERHPHHVGLVSMVEEALNGIHAALKKKVSDRQALVAGKDAEKLKRDAATIEAGKELMECKISAAKTEFQMYEATQAYEKTVVALKDIKKDQLAADKAYAKLVEHKEQIDALKAKISGLKETKCSPSDCGKLEAELKTFGVDASLAESLHLVFGKEPAGRSEFDGTIVVKLDAELAALTSSCDGKLQAEEPGKKAREEAMTAAQSAHDAAKDKLSTLETEFKAAESKVKDGYKAVTAAEKNVNTYQSDMEEADSTFAATEEELQAFNEVLSMFVSLKDRSNPPPPASEPEVPLAEVPPAADEESR